MATRSNFPRYRRGDVVISLTSNIDDDLVLHSDVLTKESEFFKKGLTSPWLQSKISGTKIVDDRIITLKRYELIQDEECEDLVLLEGKPTPSDVDDRCKASKSLIAAYTLAFALMYEDIEGTVDVDHHLGDTFLKEPNTFMDAYRCYQSRPMRLRLQALILESPKIGSRGIDAEAPRYIPIGKGLHSPDIYICAARAAALGYYFSQREHSKHPYLARQYDKDTMDTMKFWGDKIANAYDPIVDELDRLASSSVAQLQVYRRDRAPLPLGPSIRFAAVYWTDHHRKELYSLAPHDPANGTCGTTNYLWDLYTSSPRIGPKPHWSHPSSEEEKENVEFLLPKAREIVSPLYKDMWVRQSSDADSLVSKMLKCNLDPVPCTRKELAEAARSIVKEEKPYLMINVSDSVKIVPENRREYESEQVEDIYHQLGLGGIFW